MSNRTGQARAAAVSRVLARAGMRPLPSGTPRGREGMRVQPHGADAVRVSIDLDHGRKAVRAAESAQKALVDAGYMVGDIVVIAAGLVAFKVTRSTWIV